MADNTLALQVQPTQFGQNFSAGFNNGINQQAAQAEMASAALAEKQKSMQALYMMSAGVLRDGEASPEEWDGVVAMMEQNGADPAFVEKLRGNPDMARILATGSGEALKFSQDERQMDLQMQKLAADIDMAAQDRALRTRQLDQSGAELDWKKSQPLSVSQGETLLDPQTQEPIFTGPTAAKDEAPIVKEFYDEKTGQPYMAQWNPQTEKWDRIGGAKAQSQGLSVTTNPDGTVSVTQGGKLTEGQSKDIGFYTRGLQANQGLAELEGQLTDFWMSQADLIPLGIGNYAKTPEFRQAKIEGDNFLTAILRKDTGAAITPKEFDIYGPMFLPIPGDDEGTIALKRQKRATALMAIRSGLGTAEAVAAANEGVLGLDTPTKEAVGGGDVLDWTEMDWDN